MQWWQFVLLWQPICYQLIADIMPAAEAALIVEKKHTENFTILYVEGLIKLGESAEFFSSALENDIYSP